MAFQLLFPFVLTKENFEEWSNKKKDELISKGLWEIVECGYEWPKDVKNMTEKESMEFKSLRWKDFQARVVMCKNIDQEAIDHVLGEKNLKDSWKLLKEVYAKDGIKI